MENRKKIDKRRHIVVGDIHGCFDEFMELLKLTDYKVERDHLVLVGDLLDRGPKSGEVVRWAHEHRWDISVIQGNHEVKHLRFMFAEIKAARDHRSPNRVSMPDYAREAYKQMTNEHRFWMKKLPHYLRLPQLNLVVVHGGLLPGKTVEEHLPTQVIYTRYLDRNSFKSVPFGPPPDFAPPENSVFWTEIWDGPENVAFGHHVLSMEEVLHLNSKSDKTCYALDTGCCFGGKLSAAVWDLTKTDYDVPEIVSVKASAVYHARGTD